MPEYSVFLTWDEEAAVWIASSDDIPSLVLESGSIDALMERVRFAAPELMELNDTVPKEIYISFVIENKPNAE